MTVRAETRATEESPSCGRCGSLELRRSHSRTTLHQLVRRATPLDRYACRTCGYRGWARGPFGPRLVPGSARLVVPRSDTPGGRKPEQRDHRLKRRVRTRTMLLVGFSLLLGILAALSMQRCGIPGPPAE